MYNLTPLPKNNEFAKKAKKKISNQQQQLSFLKMIAAIVVGNGIVLAGLFSLFLLYLNTLTYID